MAGIKVTGLEQLRARTAALSKMAAEEALIAAENAAASLIRDSQRTAAPVGPTGKLRRSIRIFKGRVKSLVAGGRTTAVARILIGPEKKTGYYGFFREKGRKGFLVKAKKAKMLHWTKDGRDIFARRARVGPQPARPWAAPATAGIEQAAFEAGTAAFDAIIRKYSI